MAGLPRRGWESHAQLVEEDSWRSWHFQREEHTTSDGRGSLTLGPQGMGPVASELRRTAGP